MSGHSDFWILSNLGASSIFTWMCADTASAACPSQSSELAITFITVAAVICDADVAVVSENGICSCIVFDNVATKYKSTFVLLILRFQFCVFEMSNVHQCSQVDFFSCLFCAILITSL